LVGGVGVKKEIKIFFYQYDIIKGIFIIVILLLIFFYLSYRYITVERTSMEGTVIGFNASHSDEGSHPYLVIKLDDNQTIHSYIPTSSMYRKNQRVSITKSNTFGFNTYKFNRYIEVIKP